MRTLCGLIFSNYIILFFPWHYCIIFCLLLMPTDECYIFIPLQISVHHNESDKLPRGGLDKMTLIEVWKLVLDVYFDLSISNIHLTCEQTICLGRSTVLLEPNQNIWWQFWWPNIVWESILCISKSGTNECIFSCMLKISQKLY